MPVNEINAPYYLKVKYNTQVARHIMHLYFETGATLAYPTILAPGDFGIAGAGGGTSNLISVVVREIFNRFKASLNLGTVVEQIDIWAGVPGANTFIGSNVVNNTGSAGTATGIAAANRIFIYSTPLRKKFRLNFYDVTDSRPQRFPGSVPPLLDDGSLSWWMLNSTVPFATNDGDRLTIHFSENTGYNRKLANRYGRNIQP